MLENMDICMKKRVLNHTSHHAQNLRYATALNVKASTLNFLEEIQEISFCLSYGQSFLEILEAVTIRE